MKPHINHVPRYHSDDDASELQPIVKTEHRELLILKGLEVDVGAAPASRRQQLRDTTPPLSPQASTGSSSHRHHNAPMQNSEGRSSGNSTTSTASSSSLFRSRRSQPPQTLSAAHKQWLLCVAGTTMFLSFIIVLLLQHVKVRRLQYEDNHSCTSRPINDLIDGIGLDHKALPPNLQHTFTLEARSKTKDKEFAGGPYTAVMSLCNGSLDVPKPGFKKCLMRKKVSVDSANGTVSTEQIVPVQYLFAIWNNRGECIDYFDGTRTPSSGFELEEEDAETNTSSSSVSAGSFKASFASDAHSMLVPKKGRHRYDPTLRIVVKPGHDDDERPRLYMNSFADRNYALMVPLAELAGDKFSAAAAMWKQRQRKQSIPGSQHGDGNYTSRPKYGEYNIFGHRFHNLTANLIMPLFGIFLLPLLVATAVLLYRRNAQLSAAIHGSKKEDTGVGGISSRSTSRDSRSSASVDYHGRKIGKGIRPLCTSTPQKTQQREQRIQTSIASTHHHRSFSQERLNSNGVSWSKDGNASSSCGEQEQLCPQHTTPPDVGVEFICPK